jgi:hypothetical protein
LIKFKKSNEEGFVIEFNSSLSNKPSLVIDYNTNYDMIAPQFYESEFYLYGEIYQEGGKNRIFIFLLQSLVT